MISTKLTLQSYTLVLVVFTVFTVSLTETIQISDGFLAFARDLEFNVQRGDVALQTWKIMNDKDEPLYLEMFAKGHGSELYIFEKDIVLEPKETREIEIFVEVPMDHPDNVLYYTEVYAKKISAPIEDENEQGAQINITIQQRTKPIIKIGDNPIPFVPEVVKEVPTDSSTEKSETTSSSPEIEEVKEVGETMEEKLARIKATNLANQLDETQIKTTDKPEIVEKLIPIDDPICGTGTVLKDGMCVPDTTTESKSKGGGCLIATATFGSELAPQVQLLREIRDNQLMGTGSGMAFMTGFNSLYYSFSPGIADMERENPAFKELVKITITPMLSTLSVMDYAETESEVLGYGIGVILMNLGMYVGLPAFGIIKLIQFRKN